MTIPRRQKTACIPTLSAALAICLLPMGAAQAELFGPHYSSWGWDDYRPHYRSWGWDDYEPYRQRRHRAHKGYELEQKAKPQEVANGPLQIIVSIADQRISVYDDGTLIARSSVSTECRVTLRLSACLASSARNSGIGQTSTVQPPCPTCSGSPGRVSRSMPGFYPGIRHHMAAFAWQRTSPFDSGISRSAAPA